MIGGLINGVRLESVVQGLLGDPSSLPAGPKP